MGREAAAMRTPAGPAAADAATIAEGALSVAEGIRRYDGGERLKARGHHLSELLWKRKNLLCQK
jgi:hypothetical protein